MGAPPAAFWVVVHAFSGCPPTLPRRPARTTFSARDLEAHTFHEEGGDSKTILQEILEPESIISGCPPDLAAPYMKKYGPMIVSGCCVHDDFMVASVVSYDYAYLKAPSVVYTPRGRSLCPAREEH